jgi:hypothetical protein
MHSLHHQQCGTGMVLYQRHETLDTNYYADAILYTV